MFFFCFFRAFLAACRCSGFTPVCGQRRTQTQKFLLSSTSYLTFNSTSVQTRRDWLCLITGVSWRSVRASRQGRDFSVKTGDCVPVSSEHRRVEKSAGVQQHVVLPRTTNRATGTFYKTVRTGQSRGGVLCHVQPFSCCVNADESCSAFTFLLRALTYRSLLAK